MDARALEQIVRHMVELDRNWKSAAPLPRSTKPLCYFAQDPESPVEGVHLIPGGRWLLVLRQQDVTLWDLDAETLDEPTATVHTHEVINQGSCMIVDSKDAPACANVLITTPDG